ncbi:MAG: gluconate 2-dehydrogenase subunit 3 family protein [Bryobacteraceae bacterium]
MKPNEFARREVVKGLAIGSTGLVTAESLLSAPNWAPRWFTPEQAELTATLADLIIPQTQTPGARAARVHEHIDLVLSEESPEIRKRFTDGLDLVNAKSRTKHGREFVKLDAEQQNAVLASMARPESDGYKFFLDVRERTVFAYYTSEIGIHQELGHHGHQVMGEWAGCPHPDHHGDPD